MKPIFNTFSTNSESKPLENVDNKKNSNVLSSYTLFFTAKLFILQYIHWRKEYSCISNNEQTMQQSCGTYIVFMDL